MQNATALISRNDSDKYSRRLSDKRNGRQPYRVVVHGLRHFCEKLPKLIGNESWDVRDRSLHTPRQLARLTADLRTCDLAFLWGGRIDMGRFLWAVRLMGVPNVVFFWCGSDVLRAKKILSSGSGIDEWIGRCIHWAASATLAEEVRELGLDCEFVQASFVDVQETPSPLPAQFSVMVFLPRAEDADLYGWDRVVSVANSLEYIRFKVVGLHPGQKIHAPANVSVHHWTRDLTSLYDDCTVLWRPVRHDAGISFMVLEALSRGRYALYTYAVPGAIQVSDVAGAKEHLMSLEALHQSGRLPVNSAGIQAIVQTYTRDIVRREIRDRWEAIIRH